MGDPERLAKPEDAATRPTTNNCAPSVEARAHDVEPHGFTYGGFPSSWYQVAWSQEVGIGDVRPLHYFGRDLVLYRGASGVAYIFDGHCPHLGAHLGYGGHTQEDDIVCPYHGWRWGTDGQNVDIPYSNSLCEHRRLGAWQVAEVGQMIWVWYDRAGRAAPWQLPDIPEARSDRFEDPFPHYVRSWPRRRVHPQFVAENAVDGAHFQFVHRAAGPGQIEEYRGDGPRFKSVQRVLFGGGKKSTWLTPQGPVEGWLDSDLWGLGSIITRFRGTDESVHVATITPVNEQYSDLRATVLVPTPEGTEPGDEPTGKAARRLAEQTKQVEHDLNVWEHMTYVQRAPLTREEGRPFGSFRRWASQFYEEPEHPADGEAPELS